MTGGYDLNCDLGEGEAQERTEAVFGLVDSVNIACGGHAGDDATQRRCLELAGLHGVRAGAHPGIPDRAGFGRAQVEGLTVGTFRDTVLGQVGRLQGHARAVGIPLHHVKLHGALYHAAEDRPELAGALLELVAGEWPGLRVYAQAGGGVIRAVQAMGSPVEVWPEGFLDRGYRSDGSLVPRGGFGALIDDPELVRERMQDLVTRGGVRAVDGGWVPLRVRTLCVHGDGPRSLDLLRALRAGGWGPVQDAGAGSRDVPS